MQTLGACDAQAGSYACMSRYAHAHKYNGRVWKMATCTYGRTTECWISATKQFQRKPHKHFDLRCPLSICVIWFSGWNDALEVRCWRTHRHTDRPNYRNPRCASPPRVNEDIIWVLVQMAPHIVDFSSNAEYVQFNHWHSWGRRKTPIWVLWLQRFSCVQEGGFA